MSRLELHAILNYDLKKMDFVEADWNDDVAVDMIKYLLEQDGEDYGLSVTIRDYYIIGDEEYDDDYY